MKQLSAAMHTIVRLHEGDRVVPALEQAMKDSYTRSAVVLCGIGALKDVEIGTNMGGGQYNKRKLAGPVSLVGLSGVITGDSSTGPYRGHLHMTVADGDSKAWGGHLFAATVMATAEIALLPVIDSRLTRRRDDKHGIEALDF